MVPIKKWPSRAQWGQFLKTLTKEEKNIFSVFLFLTVISLSFLSINFYFQNTEILPAFGGNYSEGLVGQPEFLNPIYGMSNDVDRDLIELLFSGLMKHTLNGQIIPDLAKEYQALEDGRVWEFHLKEDVFWEDGAPITVDDVIFTIKTIQNPDFKSPLRVSWLGVEIEKISETVLRFKLQKPSAVFLENCTLKIIPEHIWKSVSPENSRLSLYNLKPIGSGPYKLEKLIQKKNEEGKITSLSLIKNPKYFEKGPNIPKITFHFFDKEEDLIESYLRGEIKGFTININSLENLPKSDLGLQLYSFSLPRYFALFFNLEESKVFAEEEVRKALNYGTDKAEFVETVLSGHGKTVHSPISSSLYGFNEVSTTYQFDQEKAKEILDKAGFSERNQEGFLVKIVKKATSFQFQSNLQLKSSGNEVTQLQKCLAQFPDVYPEGDITGYFGSLTKAAVIRFQEKYASEVLAPYGLTQGTGQVKTSTRAKLNELCNTKKETLELKFSLATADQPLLIQTAFLLKNQWEKLGVEINVETFDASTTLEREIIKKRDYDALLFGELLGAIPDPFPFWHSSQKRDPGLNLSLYQNSKVDKLLEDARQSLDNEIRKEKLQTFQELLVEDAPAVFLYNPDYIYLVLPEIKGIKQGIIIDPSKRFSDIENWYIKTKRGWK